MKRIVNTIVIVVICHAIAFATLVRAQSELTTDIKSYLQVNE